MATTVTLPRLLVSRADQDLMRRTVAGVVLQGKTTGEEIQDATFRAILAAAPERGWTPERIQTLCMAAQDIIVEQFAAAVARVIEQEAASQ